MCTVSCIIWNEIVPQHWHAVETLDRTLHDLRDIDKPFGGVTLLMGGDFQQMLPIIPKGSQEEILDATITWSYLWKDINVLHLHQNMWLRGDSDAETFGEWLLEVGHGPNSDKNGEIEIPQEMRFDDIEDLKKFIYPGIASCPPPPAEYFLNQMILAPRNFDVNDMNESLPNQMNGDTKSYYSANNIIHESGADDHNYSSLTPEFLRSLKSPSLPSGELNIKIGCPLILLRNLSSSNGLCN